VILTGWNDKYNRNIPLYYKVPYSSHSNYRELERFVKAVSPRKLIFNVDDRGDDSKARAEFQQYLVKEYVNNRTAITRDTVPAVVRDTTSYSKMNGYQKAVLGMASRFDSNNRELNT